MAGRIHHVGDLLVRVRVGLTHEGVAQHADANLPGVLLRPRSGHRSESGAFTHRSRLRRESGIEGNRRSRKVVLADGSQRLRCAPLAIHAVVLPFDGQGSLVADPVQGPDYRILLHVAVADRHEVPAPSRVSKIQVRTKDSVAPRELQSRILPSINATGLINWWMK